MNEEELVLKQKMKDAKNNLLSMLIENYRPDEKIIQALNELMSLEPNNEEELALQMKYVLAAVGKIMGISNENGELIEKQ